MGSLTLFAFLVVCSFSSAISSDDDFEGSLGSLGLSGTAPVSCRPKCSNKVGYVVDDDGEEIKVATSKQSWSCKCNIRQDLLEEIESKGYSLKGLACYTKMRGNQCYCNVSPKLSILLMDDLKEDPKTACKLSNDCVCALAAPFSTYLTDKGINPYDYSSRYYVSPANGNKWLRQKGVKVISP